MKPGFGIISCEMVRGTVEETLNALLDAEADRLCGAGRYERTQGRQDTRAGSYERSLHTVAGEVNLKVPKLRRQTFETAIIERYRRRESSVEEALIEMYLAGISVRRVEDITEALWGTRVSPSTVSNLNKKIYAKIEAWPNRRIDGEHPYLYLDGIVMKRSWAGEVRNVSLLVASAVNSEGFREILGLCEGAKEDKSGWSTWGAAGHFRPCRGLGRERRGFPAGRAIPALHGAFLSQRLQPRPFDQGSRGEPHAQGHSCAAEPRGRPREGTGDR
jgi:transposase-like protein